MYIYRMRQGLALAANGIAALICSPIAGALIAAGHDDFKYAIAFAVSEAAVCSPEAELTFTLPRAL